LVFLGGQLQAAQDGPGVGLHGEFIHPPGAPTRRIIDTEARNHRVRPGRRERLQDADQMGEGILEHPVDRAGGQPHRDRADLQALCARKQLPPGRQGLGPLAILHQELIRREELVQDGLQGPALIGHSQRLLTQYGHTRPASGAQSRQVDGHRGSDDEDIEILAQGILDRAMRHHRVPQVTRQRIRGGGPTVQIPAHGSDDFNSCGFKVSGQERPQPIPGTPSSDDTTPQCASLCHRPEDTTRWQGNVMRTRIGLHRLLRMLCSSWAGPA